MVDPLIKATPMLAKEGREKRGGEEEEKARKKLAREKDAEVAHEASGLLNKREIKK